MRCKTASRSRFCASAVSTTRLSSSLPSSLQYGFVSSCELTLAVPMLLLQPWGITICGRWNSGARLQEDKANERKVAGPSKYLFMTISLRSQSHHWIQLRRLACREIAEDQPGRRCAHKSQHGWRHRKNYGHPTVAQRHAGNQPDENAKHSAGCADHCRLDIELQQDVAHAR